MSFSNKNGRGGSSYSNSYADDSYGDTYSSRDYEHTNDYSSGYGGRQSGGGSWTGQLLLLGVLGGSSTRT